MTYEHSLTYSEAILCHRCASHRFLRLPNPQADIIDFSGKYNIYPDGYTGNAYENEDPLQSLGVESLYMGALSGGCGSWYITSSRPSGSWDVGSIYYRLYPLADPGDDGDW